MAWGSAARVEECRRTSGTRSSRSLPDDAPGITSALTKRELQGAEGILEDDWWHHQQLRSRGNTIEAGTSEVLRNIVAERVLGLPKGR